MTLTLPGRISPGTLSMLSAGSMIGSKGNSERARRSARVGDNRGLRPTGPESGAGASARLSTGYDRRRTGIPGEGSGEGRVAETKRNDRTAEAAVLVGDP